MNYKELIRLSQVAANEWRNDHTFYQAGVLIDSLCSAVETLLDERDKAADDLCRIQTKLLEESAKTEGYTQ